MIFSIFSLGVVVFLIWNHRHWQCLPWPKGGLTLPSFQAHRGFHQYEIENTLASFRAAAANGAEMIELDVQFSKDRVVVVFHDKNLQRLGHESTLVRNVTAAELKVKTQAPSLQEILADKKLPLKINIEIKNDAVFRSDLEKAVSGLIQAAHAEARVLISSFNPLSLYRMSVLLPDVPRALLVSREDGPGNRFYLKQMWLAPYINIHLLHLDYRDVTEKILKKYQQRGIPIALWTIDDQSTAEAMLNSGAVSIISNVILKEANLKSLNS